MLSAMPVKAMPVTSCVIAPPSTAVIAKSLFDRICSDEGADDRGQADEVADDEERVEEVHGHTLASWQRGG